MQRWLLMVLAFAAFCTHGDQTSIFNVLVRSPQLLDAIYQEPDLDVWHVKQSAMGMIVSLASENGTMIRFLNDHPFLPLLWTDVVEVPRINVSAARANDPHYRTADEVEQAMNMLETQNPQIARVYTLGTSVEGRSILALKLSRSPDADDPARPEVVFVGCHHAREWISVEVVLRLAEFIACAQQGQRIAALLDGLEMWFIPLLNPDGYIYTQQGTAYRYWRKNRRKNGDGSYGVDLNRNYDFMWGTEGASTDPRTETYMGPSAASEPEVQALRNFLGYRDPSYFLYSAVSANTIKNSTGSSTASLQAVNGRPAVVQWSSLSTYLMWSIAVTAPGNYRVELGFSCDTATSGSTYMLTISNGGGSQTTLQGTITATYKAYLQFVSLAIVSLTAGTITIVMSALRFGPAGVMGNIYGVRLVNREAPLTIPKAGLLSQPIGLLSYHSYGQQVLWPVGAEYQAPANFDLLQGMASKMTALIQQTTGAVYTQDMANSLYLAAGDAVDWFWYYHDGAPAFTIELPPADTTGGVSGFDLSPDQIESVVLGNIPAALYFADYVFKHRSETWLNTSFADDINASVGDNGVLPWFPSCRSTSYPACVTTMLNLCNGSSSAAKASPTIQTSVIIIILALYIIQ